MIPTGYKAKLSKLLSYPVGAEALSEGLAGAPHVEAMRLSFYDRNPHRVAVMEAYPIVCVRYEPPRKPGRSAPSDLVGRGWYDGHWSVTVYPVLRTLRHAANRLVRDEGLPAVAGWLRASGHVGWDAHWHAIELVFHPTDLVLTVVRSDGV